MTGSVPQSPQSPEPQQAARAPGPSIDGAARPGRLPWRSWASAAGTRWQGCAAKLVSRTARTVDNEPRAGGCGSRRGTGAGTVRRALICQGLICRAGGEPVGLTLPSLLVVCKNARATRHAMSLLPMAARTVSTTTFPDLNDPQLAPQPSPRLPHPRSLASPHLPSLTLPWAMRQQRTLLVLLAYVAATAAQSTVRTYVYHISRIRRADLRRRVLAALA